MEFSLRPLGFMDFFLQNNIEYFPYYIALGLTQTHKVI